MKAKSLLITIFLGASTLGSAQTITYANFSSGLGATHPVTVGQLSSFNTSLCTQNGNPVTWDASALTPQAGYPTINFVFGSPSATSPGSNYPSASHVWYDPALTTSVGYEYFIYDVDSISTVGSWQPSTEHEVFQNPDKHLIFPFAYGANFTDSYAKTNYSDATTVSSNQTGTRTVTYSGYGDLILPQGTFSGVALVAEHRTNSLGPDSYYYNWYEVATGNRLLYYETNNGDEVLAYTANTPSSVTPSTLADFDMGPNPSSGWVNISISGSAGSKIGKLKVLDLQGRVKLEENDFQGELNLDCSKWAKGIYVVQFQSVNGASTLQKLILE